MVRKRKRTLGFGFRDEVEKVTFSGTHFFKKAASEDWKDFLLPNFDYRVQNEQEEDNQTFSLVNFSANKSFWRTTLFLAFSCLLFFAVFLRLFHLQVAHGKENRELADGNRIQIKVVHAPRGVIYDRNGKILAENAPGFRLKDESSHKYRIISREEALDLEARNDPQAVNLEVDNLRVYPQGESLAHVVGYVGEITEKQLKNSHYKDYRSGDRVGQSGIEAQYESLLKGIDGGEIIEVDSQGRSIRVLRQDSPISGHNIYLTVDGDLQAQVYKNLKESAAKAGSCCGAAIAEDPNTGQILALVSYPSFDPNIFTSRVDDTGIAEVFSNPNSPVLNRAIEGTYPPGSTFKIISSIAALGNGVSPDTQIEDNGVTSLGPYKFTNWYFTQYGKTEGPVNMIKALKRSNDTYFYQIGQRIGEQALIDWSKKLYLGRQSGIDLPGEAFGLVADHQWKEKNQNTPWYPGDTLHMAIGQGFLLTTPLQVLGYTSMVANDGTFLRPQLLLKVTDENSTVSEFKPQVIFSKIIPDNDISVIQAGLKEVPKDGGTAWPFFTFPIPTAGKTGTAEFGDPKNKTHAWYTSYAPATNPKIAMTVLLEAAGEGSNVAAPVVKESYRWFLSPDKNNLIKDTSYTESTASARTLGE